MTSTWMRMQMRRFKRILNRVKAFPRRKVYKVRDVEIPSGEKLCPKCGSRMRSSNLVLMSNPPQYVYECPECGERITVRGKETGEWQNPL